QQRTQNFRHPGAGSEQDKPKDHLRNGPSKKTLPGSSERSTVLPFLFQATQRLPLERAGAIVPADAQHAFEMQRPLMPTTQPSAYTSGNLHTVFEGWQNSHPGAPAPGTFLQVFLVSRMR